ncbi:MAG: winged helix-turn-helix transcriptional regulator [Myxococcales bacterium]|nr:winged helix-turn-helix transcriptional regulator [Myxococcales bacterium]
MHAVVFDTKRVFLSFLRVMRRPLLQWPGLTGARFDMLSGFLNGFHERPVAVELRQSELRGKLGVCASVVSRMVRSLEKLGWVARRRDPRDRRTWWLCLTERGEQVIREARRLLLRSAARLVEDAICGSGGRGRDHRFDRLIGITGYLGSLRNGFADRATLDYPWWPKLIDPWWT